MNGEWNLYFKALGKWKNKGTKNYVGPYFIALLAFINRDWQKYEGHIEVVKCVAELRMKF